MRNPEKDLKNACREILAEIKKGKINTPAEMNSFKVKTAGKHRLSKIPKNSQVILFATEGERKKFRSILTRKFARTLSGVNVIAIMTSPHKCPGECIYCPEGIGVNAPKSYTGHEPAAMRAVMNNFSAAGQVENRLEQLEEINRTIDKIELIIMGGTFLSQPSAYRKKFMLDAINAITGKNTRSLESAKKHAEKSKRRISGITFETRPDFCTKKHISNMLDFGGTRVELGVQNIDDAVYKKIKRGHTTKDVIDATALLKDSAMKVAYHLMPGLPYTTPASDLRNFKKIFTDPDFKPDMLKIYPCLVIEGTELYKMWKKGEYKPLQTKQATELIASLKQHVPKWVRIMRIQRDVPANYIAAGVKESNLREIVNAKMHEKNAKCRCIRCREAGLKGYRENILPENVKILREDYDASRGKELFISAEDEQKDLLVGFCRLRIPRKPFRKELTKNTALVRELHVYSQVLGVGKKPSSSDFQHRGYGKKLLAEAEKIAAEEFDMKKIAVISGLGVKPYYHALGYRNNGAYVSKKLIL